MGCLKIDNNCLISIALKEHKIEVLLHYSFGMDMKTFQADSNGYRYGMNGQEKDDEIAGSGNSYTAEFWQYDARLGRRFNVDPKSSVLFSPYSCFSNNPIANVDPLGDTTSYYSEGGDKLFTTFDNMDNRVIIIKADQVQNFKASIKAQQDRATTDGYADNNHYLDKDYLTGIMLRAEYTSNNKGYSYKIAQISQFYEDNKDYKTDLIKSVTDNSTGQQKNPNNVNGETSAAIYSSTNTTNGQSSTSGHLDINQNKNQFERGHYSGVMGFPQAPAESSENMTHNVEATIHTHVENDMLSNTTVVFKAGAKESIPKVFDQNHQNPSGSDQTSSVGYPKLSILVSEKSIVLYKGVGSDMIKITLDRSNMFSRPTPNIFINNEE
jgi:RHS repeat-associated protein